jgi:hypothetical protein
MLSFLHFVSQVRLVDGRQTSLQAPALMRSLSYNQAWVKKSVSDVLSRISRLKACHAVQHAMSVDNEPFST